MPVARVNGVGLYYELTGAGAPLVTVHGSWGDHHSWDAVAPKLAQAFRVLTYDRRGHSASERPAGQGSVHEDAADLAALIEHLDLAPAHIAGNSYGAIITLRLAASRPELFRSLVINEPPLLGLVKKSETNPALVEFGKRIEEVVARMRAGDLEGGARQFAETVSGQPGDWDRLPERVRQTNLFNAVTWLDEMRDPDALTIDLGNLQAFPHPALVGSGDQSPAFFPIIADRVAAALPRARRHVFAGAGHVPHATRPDDYVRVVTEFIRRAG